MQISSVCLYISSRPHELQTRRVSQGTNTGTHSKNKNLPFSQLRHNSLLFSRSRNKNYCTSKHDGISSCILSYNSHKPFFLLHVLSDSIVYVMRRFNLNDWQTLLHCVILYLLLFDFAISQQIFLSDIAGSISMSVTSSSIRREYTIAPINPRASSIQFIFRSINMQQAEMRIYDSDSVDAGRSIFSCSSCGSILPPPFNSQTGDIYIVVSGVSGVGFEASDFTLQYIGYAMEYCDDLAFVSTSLTMGYGHLSPITVLNTIQADSVQRWIIQQQQNAIITLYFSSLFNRLSDTICGSTVSIYDQLEMPRRTLFSTCVENSSMPLQWFYSFSGIAVVELITLSQPTGAFFEITFVVDTELFQCGSFSQPDILRGRSMILVDGSKSTGYQHRGESCSWLIQPEARAEISLVFSRVSLKCKCSGKLLIPFSRTPVTPNPFLFQ